MFIELINHMNSNHRDTKISTLTEVNAETRNHLSECVADGCVIGTTWFPEPKLVLFPTEN